MEKQQETPKTRPLWSIPKLQSLIHLNSADHSKEFDSPAEFTLPEGTPFAGPAS